MASRSYLWPGVPLALSSAVLFGVSTPFSKIMLEGASPWLLAGLLYIGAGFGLALVRASTCAIGTAGGSPPLRPSEFPLMLLIALLGGGVAPVLLMLGLTTMPASSSSLLLNVEGLATMGIAWLVYRENVDRRLLLGALAIVVGAAVLSWTGAAVAVEPGALFIVAACVAWGIDNNLTRKLSAADPVQITMIKGLVAGTTNCLLALTVGSILPSPSVIAAAMGLGFFSIGISLVLFTLALRHLGTARTGAYFSLAPFIGALVAIPLLGDPATWQLLTAGLLMGLGLWLHLSERHAHEHAHEVMQHEHSHTHDEHHNHGHDHAGLVTEPHTHWHRHAPLRHSHAHFPDLHHRHEH